MRSMDATLAATRFGLGARPGDLDQIRDLGPRTWLADQLQPRELAPALALLPSSAAGVQRLAMARAADDEDEQRMLRREQRDTFTTEQAAHLVAAASSATPFRERLVAFWSNHFTVSITRGAVASVAAAFEREVVRSNLDGSFREMLHASSRHPAMLTYLDNVRSIGPSSLAGRRSGRGLNENYARELLELHTLGVDGGYTQTDVLELARLLTGWTVDIGRPSTGMWPMGGSGTGAFSFDPMRHEPGPKTLLGHTFSGAGETDGQAAIELLATHPSTARHVARKLARHFVADDPPQSAVLRLQEAFLTSGGDLPTVHRALTELPEAFDPTNTKMKSPWDLVLSTARALDHVDQGEVMLDAMRFLGQLPYEAPSPQGWPDRAAAWSGPESVLSRLEWAEQVAQHSPVTEVVALADAVLGDALSPATRAHLDGPDALALLLACPEFQRR